MSGASHGYMRTKAIDEITAARIREYEAKTATPVSFPVPIEKIVEQVLGLSFDWDEIDEQPGEQILGGLVAEKRKIVLNEKHLELFQQKPGLERSTIGHEAGHWDIDIDRGSLGHPTFEGFGISACSVNRHSRKSELIVEVLNRALSDERFRKIHRQLTAGEDAPEVRSAVDRYQSSLLMPEWLMREAARRYDLTAWPALYDLAREAQVTISNLTVRLQRLELLYIPEGSKKLYRSHDEFIGQNRLF